MSWFSRYPIETRQGKILNQHVEINVAEHCNLSCRSCSHLSPVMPRRFVDPARVYDDLSKLATAYHAHRVSLLGGEPLLHPDLLSVIEAVRRSKVADGIRVVTNGVLLHRMSAECWSGLKEVRVSVYPGNEMSGEQSEQCHRMAQQYKVKLKINPVPDFFESYAAHGTTDAKLVKQVYATCMVAHDWRCHLVSDGYFYKCPHSYFLAKSLKLSDPGQPVDGIPISGEKRFRKELLAYLRSPEPLQACFYCLGTVGKRFAHEQVSRKTWVEPQQHTLEELIDSELLAKAQRYI